MIDAFGDDTLIAAALAFEAALARASAAEGLVPASAAELIGETCARARFDIAVLADEAGYAGTLAIPLVRRLRVLVAERDPEAAKFVHFGATSQDLADTSLMLQAKVGARLIRGAGRALAEALAALAAAHAETPMLGRTLLQGALPITLGLKAANWLLGIDAALGRFEREAESALACQLGGPVGTLESLDPAVARRLAEALGLRAPALAWHARRDGVAGLGTALAILTGAVGKIARDVSLMAQSEVGEAREPLSPGRGGSSAMAHKRNPTGCQIALSAAIRAPGLVSTLVSGMTQEHERGLGGWQAEAPHLASLFELAHGALVAMTPVIEGLEIDAVAMDDNLRSAAVGDHTAHAAALAREAVAIFRRQP
jgi:3-carboxy-cis,cis-muconate cycloisomerase